MLGLWKLDELEWLQFFTLLGCKISLVHFRNTRPGPIIALPDILF